MKLFLATDYILYIKKLRNPLTSPLELISNFNKIAG